LFIEWRLKEEVVLVGELRFVIRIDGCGILPFGGGGGIDSGLSVECDGGGGGIIDWWHDGGEGVIDDGSDEFDCVEIITIWSVVFIDGELIMGDDWSVLNCCIAYNEWWYGGGGGGDSGGGVVVGREEGGDIWSFLFNDVSNDKDCWTNDDIDCWVTGDSDDIDWAEGAVEVTRFGGFAGGIRFDDDDDDDNSDDDDSCDDDDGNGDDDDNDDFEDDDNEDDFIADGYAGLGGLESFVV